jgi:hypothetical protein
MLRNMLSYYFLPYLKRTPQMGILFQSLAPDQQKNSWLPGNRHAAVLNRKKTGGLMALSQAAGWTQARLCKPPDTCDPRQGAL